VRCGGWTYKIVGVAICEDLSTFGGDDGVFSCMKGRPFVRVYDEGPVTGGGAI
jgi:hypothetical protein